MRKKSTIIRRILPGVLSLALMVNSGFSAVTTVSAAEPESTMEQTADMDVDVDELLDAADSTDTTESGEDVISGSTEATTEGTSEDKNLNQNTRIRIFYASYI